jgi:hypothetical protein
MKTTKKKDKLTKLAGGESKKVQKDPPVKEKVPLWQNKAVLARLTENGNEAKELITLQDKDVIARLKRAFDSKDSVFLNKVSDLSTYFSKDVKKALATFIKELNTADVYTEEELLKRDAGSLRNIGQSFGLLFPMESTVESMSRDIFKFVRLKKRSREVM